MFKTPILIIIFNRPETTMKVFKVLQKIKPSKLYIAADGPRENVTTDVDKCNETRKIFNKINWDCEIYKLFQENNLGCKIGVSSAINWFFENVNEGIILEDDILPENSFFQYCAELLEYYRNDSRIMMISGHNPINLWENGYSYLFSRIGAIWGWATWKRAWNLYDVKMREWQNFNIQKILKKSFDNETQYNYRKNVFDLTYQNKIDTWDYQWTFTRLINSGLSIIPSKNLIKNIGFGSDATHYNSSETMFLKQKTYPIEFSLNHPTYVIADKNYDNQVFNETILNNKKTNFFKRVINKINKNYVT